MVYESDFYTTRRYRTSPSLSTYTVSYLPSRQVRILPGLGKVHVVHTYDRIVPYVGHKRLTVVSPPPQVFSVRPSVLLREFDRIQYKYRPSLSYSYVNNYLNSDSSVRVYYSRYPITTSYSYYPTDYYYHNVLRRPSRLYYDILGYPRWSRYWYRYWYDIPSIRYSDYYSDLLPYYPTSLHGKYLTPYWSKYWTAYDSSYWSSYWTPAWSSYWRNYWSNYWSRWYDLVFSDETSRIRADAAGVLKRIHTPVIRTPLSLLPYNTRYSEPILSSRITSDDYIYKMLTSSPHNSKVSYTTYYSEPVKKFVGPGHLASVRYSWEKAYGRRPYHGTYGYEDPVMSDIQLLSYYINKYRNERAIAGKEASAPLSPARPSRHFTPAKKIDESEKEEKRDYRDDISSIRLSHINASQQEVEDKLKRQKEIARKAEEKALADESARKQAQAKKEEAARKAELARQEELAAQAAAERAAEAERLAEQARLDELAKQAEIERIRQEEEERERLEAERRADELARAEEERQQLLRLEEIARQAEEERERELARQAEELAELARQEAELEEQARQEAEALAQARHEEELAELARQEEELKELERQEAELLEVARQEAENAEQARHDAEIAKQEAELADLATHETELEEDEPRQADEDSVGAEAQDLQHDREEDEGTEQDVRSPVPDEYDEEDTPAAEVEQHYSAQEEEEEDEGKAAVIEEPAEHEEDEE